VTTRAELRAARSAARTYCQMHALPDARSIDGPPVLGPVAITRDGRPMVAYRWLGAGRGEDYVQVELDTETGDIVVHGARGHDQLSEWRATGHRVAQQEDRR